MSGNVKKALVKELLKRRRDAERVVLLWRAVDISLVDLFGSSSPYHRLMPRVFKLYDVERISAHFAHHEGITRDVNQLREIINEYWYFWILHTGFPPTLTEVYRARKEYGERLIDGCEDLYIRAVKEGFVA